MMSSHVFVEDDSNRIDELLASHVTHHTLEQALVLRVIGNDVTVSHKGGHRYAAPTDPS